MCILFFCLFTDQNGNKYLYGAKKSEHMVLAWDMLELMCLGLNKECYTVSFDFDVFIFETYH